MRHEQFVYWLQGFAELTPGQVPTKDQWDMIVEHLAECFDKVTPEFGHKVGHTGGYTGNPNFGLFGGGAVCSANPAGSALVARGAHIGDVGGVTTTAMLVNTEASSRADTALATRIGSMTSSVGSASA